MLQRIAKKNVTGTYSTRVFRSPPPFAGSDITYTARMEGELDEIEEGKIDWRQAIGEFYEKFKQDLEHAEEHMEDIKRMEKPTGLMCDKCGKPMVIKWGRHGSFIGCSGYPECTNTRELVVDLPDVDSANLTDQADEEYCENCGRTMVLKRGRFGAFYACSGYPDCKTTKRIGGEEKKPDQLLDEKCPQCSSQLVLKHGRFGEFTACSNYPTCKYVKQKLIGVKCPECGEGELIERRSRVQVQARTGRRPGGGQRVRGTGGAPV